MKPDRKRIVIAILGVFQIIFGVLFLALGGLAIISSKSSILTTAGAPFWLAGLTLLCAYATVTTPRNYTNERITVLIYASTFTWIAAISTTVWMFSLLLKVPSKPEEKYVISAVMGLSILVMLDTGIIWATARSIRDSELCNQRRTTTRRREHPIISDPPPAYFANRMVFFGGEEFAPPPSDAGAPPPYEP